MIDDTVSMTDVNSSEMTIEEIKKALNLVVIDGEIQQEVNRLEKKIRQDNIWEMLEELKDIKEDEREKNREGLGFFDTWEVVDEEVIPVPKQKRKAFIGTMLKRISNCGSEEIAKKMRKYQEEGYDLNAPVAEKIGMTNGAKVLDVPPFWYCTRHGLSIGLMKYIVSESVFKPRFEMFSADSVLKIDLYFHDPELVGLISQSLLDYDTSVELEEIGRFNFLAAKVRNLRSLQDNGVSITSTKVGSMEKEMEDGKVKYNDWKKMSFINKAIGTFNELFTF